ncbi:MAG: putative DNA-binding domain-containing protein [Polyangiales bacterium]
MLAEHAKAMQSVCFGAEPSEADLALLGSRERWLVYRDMVRHRLVQIIGVALARTKQALGDEAFERLIDDWLSTGGPKTRYLRHVPSELTEFALPVLEATQPAWASDLARYEIATWTVRHAAPAAAPGAEISFERRPVLGTALEILRLDYPVHQSPTPPSGYEPKETILCVYRNESHRASTRKLNSLAADLLEAWKRSEETISESVQRIAAAHGTEITPVFIEKLSALIADFVSGGD